MLSSLSATTLKPFFFTLLANRIGANSASIQSRLIDNKQKNYQILKQSSRNNTSARLLPHCTRTVCPCTLASNNLIETSPKSSLGVGLSFFKKKIIASFERFFLYGRQICTQNFVNSIFYVSVKFPRKMPRFTVLRWDFFKTTTSNTVHLRTTNAFNENIRINEVPTLYEGNLISFRSKASSNSCFSLM